MHMQIYACVLHLLSGLAKNEQVIMRGKSSSVNMLILLPMQSHPVAR